MLAQITLQMKVSYAPVAVKLVSYAPLLLSLYHTPPAASCHPLYLRGGAGSLPSNSVQRKNNNMQRKNNSVQRKNNSMQRKNNSVRRWRKTHLMRNKTERA